jgi:hypothetical protein
VLRYCDAVLGDLTSAAGVASPCRKRAS